MKMNMLGIAALTALFALPACNSLSEQDQARLDTFKMNSKRYYEEEQFRRAEDACRKGLMIDSEDLSLFQVLGFSLLRQGGGNQVNEAVAIFERCLEIEDEFDYRSRLGLGEAHFQMGQMWNNELDRIAADENLTREERLEKQEYAMAAREKSYELSEGALREVLDSPRGRGDVMASSTLSRLLTVLERYDESAEVLRSMIGTLSASINLRSEMLEGEGVPKEQREMFERTLDSLKSQRVGGLELLANVAAKETRWEEVISAFAQIEAVEAMQPADYFNRARAYEALGARDAAISDYDTFVSQAAARGAAFGEQVSMAMRRKAILLEAGRDGQVFYLHNRVQTIEHFAHELRQILKDPSIKINIAHGQMAKHELEDAMIRFITGDTDVLLCSTIIESGIDIPNANTIIINDADRFGLAQLHQLRGRVGRYKHRAYAYMLLPKSRSITPIAGRRLKAIEEYSQLGAGFRIALRDLEIRGAGNILGAQQSGHINTVGYELYCRLLSEAVKRLKNEPVEKEPETVIDLGFASYIPKSYIHSDRQRMEVYRRISIARDPKDIDRLKIELRDLFGPVPEQVTQLLELSQLRIRAAKWNILSIVVQGLDVIFKFPEDATGTDLFARYPGTVRIPDPRTVHLRLEKSYFEPKTLLAVLRKLLRR